MLQRTPIALFALLIATVALMAACGNPGESVVAQPTPLAPVGEIIPIVAPADGEEHEHDAHEHDDEPAPAGRLPQQLDLRRGQQPAFTGRLHRPAHRDRTRRLGRPLVALPRS